MLSYTVVSFILIYTPTYGIIIFNNGISESIVSNLTHVELTQDVLLGQCFALMLTYGFDGKRILLKKTRTGRLNTSKFPKYFAIEV